MSQTGRPGDRSMETGERQADSAGPEGLAENIGLPAWDRDGHLVELSVSWAVPNGAEGDHGKSDEARIAEHVACYALGLSHELAHVGHPPVRLNVRLLSSPARGGGGAERSLIDLEVCAELPKLDQRSFSALAASDELGCPTWKALAGALDLRPRVMLLTESSTESTSPASSTLPRASSPTWTNLSTTAPETGKLLSAPISAEAAPVRTSVSSVS